MSAIVIDTAHAVPVITVDAVPWAPQSTTPPIPDPVPIPIPPVVTGGWYMPSSAADLQSKLQAALDNGKTLCTSPDMDLDVPAQISLTLRDVGGRTHGWNGFGGWLNWTANDAAQSIVKFTMAGPQNYGLMIEGIGMMGGLYTGAENKAGFEVFADVAVGALYQFRFNDLVTRYCNTGMWFEGQIFEGTIGDPMAQACGDGMVFRMTGNQVMSNITVRTPNIRACSGWGIRLDGVKSVDVVAGGSFINDNAGGIWADQGIRTIDGPNFENCGVSAIRQDAAADGSSKVTNCSGSNTSGGMPFLIDYRGPAAGLDQSGNSMYAGTVMKP